jgi:hypothetical protein
MTREESEMADLSTRQKSTDRNSTHCGRTKPAAEFPRNADFAAAAIIAAAARSARPHPMIRRYQMICFLSARRLKPGAYDEFRRAWEPERWPPEAVRAYHLRDIDDENLVVSFGLYQGTLADRDRIRDGHGDDQARLEQLSQHVEETLLEGVFEVVEEVEPS